MEFLDKLGLYLNRLLMIMAGIFLLVGMLERNGVIESFAHWLAGNMGDSQTTAFNAIVWSSVAFSAFIDNVP